MTLKQLIEWWGEYKQARKDAEGAFFDETIDLSFDDFIRWLAEHKV